MRIERYRLVFWLVAAISIITLLDLLGMVCTSRRVYRAPVTSPAEVALVGDCIKAIREEEVLHAKYIVAASICSGIAGACIMALLVSRSRSEPQKS